MFSWWDRCSPSRPMLLSDGSRAGVLDWSRKVINLILCTVYVFNFCVGDSKSFYEMRIRTLKPGAEEHVLHRLQESLLYHAPPPHMLALWRGEFGPSPTLYSLHKFTSFDAREPLIAEDMQKEQMRETKKFLDSHSLTVSLLALHPTLWSPLQ